MMETEAIAIKPDHDNLVRLAIHFVDKVVILTNDALIGKEYDKVSAHICAKKAQELLQQLKKI
jgi:hypothetical protein